jgi:CCR4-NOT transcription complex subunit 7/8
LKTAGINFDELKPHGIDHDTFAEHLFTSGTTPILLGLVLNQELVWITYRGTFDLGYLLKLASGEVLPATESEFLNKLQVYFPHYYDIKYMLKDIPEIPYANLSSTASILKVNLTHQN